MKMLSNKASYNINGVIEGKREENITFICFWTVLGLFFGLQGGFFFPAKGVKSSSTNSLNKETDR